MEGSNSGQDLTVGSNQGLSHSVSNCESHRVSFPVSELDSKVIESRSEDSF